MQTALTASLPILAGAATAGVGFAPTTALTVAGAAGSVGQGVMTFVGGRQRAAGLERQMEIEELRAREQAQQIREDTRRRLGMQRVQLAARGIDPDSQGVATSISRETRRMGERDLRANELNLATTRQSLNAQAREARTAGAAGLLSGFVGAASTVGNAWGWRRRIGTFPSGNPAPTPTRRPT